MIIRFIEDYENWKAGELIDAENGYAAELIGLKVAVQHENQQRIDPVPTKEQNSEPQKVEVNNFYGAPVSAKKPKISRTLK